MAISEIHYFDDQSLSAYTGDTASFNFSTTASQGTHSLHSSGSTFEQITSTSGLNDYPARGDIWEYDVRYTAGTERQYHRFFRTGDDFYNILFDPENQRLRIQRYDTGAPTTLATISDLTALAANTFYTIEIDTATGNDITVTIFDTDDSVMGTATVTDSTYNGSAISWAHNGTSAAAETWTDNARITNAPGGTDFTQVLSEVVKLGVPQ